MLKHIYQKLYKTKCDSKGNLNLLQNTFKIYL